MFGQELPSWKQLLGLVKNVSNPYFNNEVVWTSQTAVSIKLILEEWSKLNQRQSKIWIPEYFCAETINIFNDKSCDIVFYPINEKLEPDWAKIKKCMKDEQIDMFLYVHYFGLLGDINNAEVFCRNRKALLLEDCAHCLYGYEKIGTKGNFSFFSPHKLLPVKSGSFIVCNDKEGQNYEIYNTIKNRLINEKGEGSFFWRLKRAIQKVTKMKRNRSIKVEVHYGKLEDESKKKLAIDSWSKKALLSYDYKDLKKIAFKRRMNLNVMNYIVKKIIPKAEPVFQKDVYCPYMALYSIKNEDNKQESVNKLQKKGILVTYWPDLPLNINEYSYLDTAKKLSEELIAIPIHQGLDIKSVLLKTLGKINIAEEIIEFHKVDDENRKIWDNLSCERDNIPQDGIYGNVRKHRGNYRCENRLIYKNDVCIGKIQFLIKEIIGIKLFVRVNRGPLFLGENNTPENTFATMNYLKRKYRCVPILWTSNLDATPYCLHLAASYKWKFFNLAGFSSGIIDLKKSEDEIRKQLDSKWRNQLVSAEKNNFTVCNDNNRYEEIIDLYLQDQETKGYRGVPKQTLVELYEIENTPLDTYYVTCDNKILAFDIVYNQNDTGHYLVGWNSFEGRKKYINNLLLYYISIDLKKKGKKKFDLGGIDYIETEEIAKFKDGMNPTHYSLLGDFVKII